jgi:hypothetical protein
MGRRRDKQSSSLREKAEKTWKDPKRALAATLSEAEARRVLHELQVHQLELEMQNEELRISRREVEAALARYAGLFDFAPIGLH